MRFSFALASIVLFSSLPYGCSSEEAADACTAGAVSDCSCPGGGSGTRLCKADGSGFDACQCGATGGTGGGTANCSDNDCSGCTNCFERCVCEGTAPPTCLAQCTDGGTAGGTGGVATGGSAGAATGGSGGGATGGSGGSSTGGSGGSGTGGSGGSVGAGQATCGITNPDICALASEKCCVLDPGFDYCGPAAQPCQCDSGACTLLEVLCDGPEDCASGQMCCGFYDGTQYTRTECRSSCVMQNGEFEMCHQGAQCATPGTTCSTSPSLPPYLLRCRT
jgi:hypothetical protein